MRKRPCLDIDIQTYEMNFFIINAYLIYQSQLPAVSSALCHNGRILAPGQNYVFVPLLAGDHHFRYIRLFKHRLWYNHICAAYPQDQHTSTANK